MKNLYFSLKSFTKIGIWKLMVYNCVWMCRKYEYYLPFQFRTKSVIEFMVTVSAVWCPRLNIVLFSYCLNIFQVNMGLSYPWLNFFDISSFFNFYVRFHITSSHHKHFPLIFHFHFSVYFRMEPFKMFLKGRWRYTFLVKQFMTTMLAFRCPMNNIILNIFTVTIFMMNTGISCSWMASAIQIIRFFSIFWSSYYQKKVY